MHRYDLLALVCFGQLEIISLLLSGRLPYRHAIGHSMAAKCCYRLAPTVHSAVCSARNLVSWLSGNSLKLLHRDAFPDAKCAKNAFAAGALPWTSLGELTSLPQMP